MGHIQAKSFVMLMIAIALFALLLRVAIDGLININISQNESNALGSLKLISAALEKYAEDNKGAYPISFALLTSENPVYLDRDYIVQSPLKGYNYTCPRLDSSGYSCSAAPLKCKLTGRLIYTVTTGNILVSEDCEKKE